MAKKKNLKDVKEGEEIKFISKEELQNMKFNLSIDIPKEAFDELVKAMMEVKKSNANSKSNSDLD